MTIKTVKDAIEKLHTYDPNMLIGSNHSNSWGDWFSELQFSEEFADDEDRLIHIFPHIRPSQKVLVIY